MSREHFHESQIEDKVEQYMQEGMSDEDAIQKAESEYHGQVNLVEEQALKIHEEQTEIQRKLRQGCYPSEIILDKIVQHLQATTHGNIRGAYAKNLLSKIDEWTMEVNNA
tara:strand:+ start:295 stop:624 length:330 start_codon:yes stop_codon:yes gene_type:complete